MFEDQVEAVLMEYFDEGCADRVHADLNSYNALDERDAMRLFARARRIDGVTFWRHQNRIRREVWPRMEARFMANIALLSSAVDFDELYRRIDELRVPGYGATCIYDAALHIGWRCRPQLLPERVYLHTGPYEGAENLFPKRRFPRRHRYLLETDELPSRALRELSPYLIESFLCIKKDRLTSYEGERR